MIVRTPRSLGVAVRDTRKQQELTQAQLAARVGVSRQWLVGLEGGNRRAELHLVLAVLDALHLVLDLQPRTTEEASGASRPAPGAAREAVAALNQVLRQHTVSLDTQRHIDQIARAFRDHPAGPDPAAVMARITANLEPDRLVNTRDVLAQVNRALASAPAKGKDKAADKGQA